MELIGVILSLTLSAGLTWRFCDPASRFYVLDHPNERSLHARPTPRSGGLAVFIAIVPGMAFIAWRFGLTQDLFWLWPSLLLVAAVSFIDDRRHVPVVVRLFIHLSAAAVLVWGGIHLRILDFPGFMSSLSLLLGVLLSLIFIVWMINLYNFMDGMDGFAGGMAVIGFGSFALLGWQAGNLAFLWLNLITAAAAAGFLMFNFPPARIFMGDVGSSLFGLLAAMYSLWGAKEQIFPFWIALLVFSPFIMDATVTLLRRIGRREKIWRAHKTHYYQKLVQAGWGHRRTVLVEYAIMIACGASAIWGMRLPERGQILLLVGWLIFYFLFFSWITYFARRSERAG